jgi:hypothetical protein
MTRLSAVDAQTFWMSAQIPNDQFLLYAFAGEPGDLAEILAGLRGRALACADLRLRIADDCAARYPRWVDGAVEETQFVVRTSGLDWAGCLDEVARLADDQLDPMSAAWRLHVLPRVCGAPRTDSTVTVAVLQMAHSLADGTRSAELAAWLFGRTGPIPPITPNRRGSLLLRGVAAARAHRQLVADTAAGTVPPPAGLRPALLTNAAPQGPRRIRTLLRGRRELTAPGATVTVAALAAIGGALAGYLSDAGDDPSRLGAEVPMVNHGIRHARNHFHNIGVGLHPDAAPDERAGLLARELRDARVRGAHPAMLAESRSLAAIPAPLLRWGVTKFDPTARAPAVTGNTVVSSVNRGPGDLRFGAARVLLTAGYPALSPMMGLTHGVHGIGDTVAVSVHTAESVCGANHLDDYVARLDAALG